MPIATRRHSPRLVALLKYVLLQWTILIKKKWFSFVIVSAFVILSAHRHKLTPSVSLSLRHSRDGGRRNDHVRFDDVEHQPTVESTPSYLQLCNEFLHRKQNSSAVNNMDYVPYVVTERQSICHRTDAPFSALMEMFAAQLVATIGNGMELGYHPDCATKGEVGMMATVQQLLPSPLLVSELMGEWNEEKLGQLCSNCIETKGSVECLGFPVDANADETGNGSVEGFEAMVPTIQSNMQLAAEHATRLAISTNLPSTHSERYDGAIIYISPSSEVRPSESGAMAVPFYFYGSRIPPSVLSVTVLTTPQCEANVAGCLRHAGSVTQYLQSLLPRADVTLDVVSSTAEAYGRMIQAKYLLCPGTGVSCVLPALARNGEGRRTTLVSSEPWIHHLFQSSVGSLSNIELLSPEEDQPQEGRSIPWRPMGPMDEMQPFLQTPPQPNSEACLALRGKMGQWVQDWEYAARAQYATPLLRFRAFEFTPTDAVPYRQATSYRWTDSACPIEHATLEGMCGVLENLGITRIFIVGDSLNLQLAQALWKVMGMEDDPTKRKSHKGWKPWSHFQWTRTVQCPYQPGQQQFEFDISFARNDLIDSQDEPVTFDKVGTGFNCGTTEYCFPWLKQYDRYKKGRTLLIASVGAHIHTEKLFRQTFDNFVDVMRQHQQPDDLVMFRTTVPGHDGCNDPGVRPLLNHAEFEKTLPADYRTWHKFSGYNDYVYRRLHERNFASAVGGEKSSGRIHVLDVYPMTVLRIDGHVGGPESCVGCKQDDCLHYALPGPTDWWVHLLYSNLFSIGGGVAGGG